MEEIWQVLMSKISSAFPYTCCISLAQRKWSNTQDSADKRPLLPVIAEWKRALRKARMMQKGSGGVLEGEREGRSCKNLEVSSLKKFSCFHAFSLWAACAHRLYPVCLQWLPAVSPGWAPGPCKCGCLWSRKWSHVLEHVLGVKTWARGGGGASAFAFTCCPLSKHVCAYCQAKEAVASECIPDSETNLSSDAFTVLIWSHAEKFVQYIKCPN